MSTHKMKYPINSVRAVAAILITAGSLSGGANAAMIAFDDALEVLGELGNPSSFYNSQGVTISGLYLGLVGGVSNGDPGNWDLEGTVGAAFLGTNQGTSGNPTIQFSDPQTGSIDIGVPFGWTSFFLVSGSLDGSSVFSSSISINDNNSGQGTWRTFVFSSAIDTLVVQLTSGTASAYGIDNVQFAIVPEPSSVVLLGLGGLGIGMRRRRNI